MGEMSETGVHDVKLKKNQFLNSKLQAFKGDMVECYFINCIRANLVKYRCVLQ